MVPFLYQFSCSLISSYTNYNIPGYYAQLEFLLILKPGYQLLHKTYVLRMVGKESIKILFLSCLLYTSAEIFIVSHKHRVNNLLFIVV